MKRIILVLVAICLLSVVAFAQDFSATSLWLTAKKGNSSVELFNFSHVANPFLTMTFVAEAQEEYDFVVMDIQKGHTGPSWWVEVVFRQKGGNWRVVVRKSDIDDYDHKQFTCLANGDEVRMAKDAKGVWHLRKAPCS